MPPPMPPEALDPVPPPVGVSLKVPAVPLYHPATSERGLTQSARGDALPLRVPDQREIRAPLELQRALRPLKRTVRTGAAAILDEEATVTCSADTDRGMVVPVWRNASERWLSLALVVDTAPSMILWKSLVAELGQLMAQLGAFKMIKIWELSVQNGVAAIAPPGSPAAPRSARELIDPAGRQLVLVVSDCVSDRWKPGGAAMRAVETWARTAPLAILQPLSQDLWSRSAVQWRQVRLCSPYAAAPNGRLTVDNRPAERAGPVVVPILECEADWLASWARLVSGTEPVDAAATFCVETAAAPRTTKRRSGDDASPRKIVERFRAGASHDAFKLAGLLADVPLSLPLMRHVQKAMLPGSRSLPLAEVYLGGLLRMAKPSPGEDEAGPRFEFLPGVDELLRGTVRRSEALRVSELVAEQLAREPIQGGYVATVGGPATPGKSSGRARRPYAWVPRWKLFNMGGSYRRIATSAATRWVSTELARPLSPLRSRPGTDRTGSSRAALAWRFSRRFNRGDHRIPLTMLGAPSSGKTTFVAALSIALARDEEVVSALGGGELALRRWSIIGADSRSNDDLTSMTRALSSSRGFPAPTSGVQHLRFQLGGRVSVVDRRLLEARRRSAYLKFDLELADTAGELARNRYSYRGELIDTLLDSRGIIFLFDPVSEKQRGDAFAHLFGVVAELAQRMSEANSSFDGYLPHFIAVCISKFDDDRVYRSARELGLLTFDAGDRFGFPHVYEDDCRYFFTHLCRYSRSGNADLIMQTIDQYFRPDRIKYFVTSSIGFHVDPSTDSFSPDDVTNLEPVPGDPGRQRIRGNIHPINVAEPVLWLTRKLAANSR